MIKTKSIKDRLQEKIIIADNGCWLWVASGVRGYGQLWANGRLNLAHRISYQEYIGEIPDGLVIDHLCRNRSCINPQHLEPVTNLENLHRSPLINVCKHGTGRSNCRNGCKKEYEKNRIKEVNK